VTRIVVLAGGVGGSRFVLGLRDAVRGRWPGGADGGNGGGTRVGTVSGSTASITVIANTGDDLWLSGVRLQPDVDSLLYALAGVGDTARGWGRADESSRAWDEDAAFGAGWPWFTLGDLDLGTHLARTGWLREDVPLTEIVTRLSARWDLGGVRILPMTESEVDTRVLIADESGAGERSMHFEEWWVRHRAQLPARRFDNPGIESAVPAPGVLEAIAEADLVVLAPSNPVVSIGPILSVPGMRAALREAPGRIVGVSPIIGGSVVRGMADACLEAIGVATAADAVGRLYGAREHGGLLDAWLIGEEDAALAEGLRATGLPTVVTPLWMRDAQSSEALAHAALTA